MDIYTKEFYNPTLTFTTHITILRYTAYNILTVHFPLLPYASVHYPYHTLPFPPYTTLQYPHYSSLPYTRLSLYYPPPLFTSPHYPTLLHTPQTNCSRLQPEVPPLRWVNKIVNNTFPNESWQAGRLKIELKFKVRECCCKVCYSYDEIGSLTRKR